MDAERLIGAFASAEQEDIARHLTNEALAVELFRRGWLRQLNSQSSIYVADVEGSMQPLQPEDSADRVRGAAFALLNQLQVLPDGTGINDEYPSDDPEILALPVHELKINTGGLNALYRAGIYSIRDVVKRDIEDLSALTGFGEESMRRLQDALFERGLHLRRRRPSRH